MSRAVRKALMVAGVVALAWVLIVLAWRIVRWLFLVGVRFLALKIAGAILLAKVVTRGLSLRIARLRRDQAKGPPRPQELNS